MAEPHVVILGGGFGGLEAARTLGNRPVRVTLIDRRNHHLFQPLLYQVATAGLSAPEIAAPIRRILKRYQNITVLLGEATGIDVERKYVELADGAQVEFDYLIVATGATHSYFGHPEWEQFAPGLKTVDDAFEIRRRVLLAFEHAERETDPEAQRAWLHFVVIGGGPTGVELAGALAEIAHHSLLKEFRNFDPASAKVLLVEGGDRVLGAMPPELSEKAQAQLEKMGVEVRTGCLATDVDETGIQIGDEHIEARVVLWAAGVKASPLGASMGAETDKAGRVPVEPELHLKDHGHIYVIGDLAKITQEDGEPVPGLAPAALQAGRHAANNVLRQAAGKEPEPFVYQHKGVLATIGRAAAVAEIGKLRLSGFIAWVAWLTVHIVTLIGFRNRLAVLLDWAWAWITYQRSASVVLEERTEPEPARGQASVSREKSAESE